MEQARPRAQEPLPLRLRYSGPSRFITAYQEDPELRGVFVQTKVAVPIGTQVHLVIDIGGATRLRGLGEVVRPAPVGSPNAPGVGVRFLRLDPGSQEWLDRESGKANPGTAQGHLLREATSADRLSGAMDDLQTTQDLAGEPIVGIDLGTTNSCACVFKDGKPVLIEVAAGASSPFTLPSVVTFDDRSRAFTGERAINGLRDEPKRTVFGAKRFVGRSYNSPEVQEMVGRFPYRVIPDEEHRVGIEINGEVFSLTEISAHLLSELRSATEERLRQPVHRAIITVPAYYNDNQRQAVVNAGRRAGLTVERILNEPTAAAVAYGLASASPGRFLVYDLGGGTFDVSVMSVFHGKLKVLATAGDTFLGGDDFDHAIASYVVDRFHRETGRHLSRNHTAMAQLKRAAEQAKCRLTNHDTTTLMVREAALIDGSKARIEMPLTREMIEKLVEPLIRRTFDICALALNEAGTDPMQLVDVILVGGQTRMPCVCDQVQKYFNKKPRCHIDPEQAVALGVGTLPYLSKVKHIELRDVLPMTIGLGVESKYKPVFRRNTSLPCSKKIKVKVPKHRYHSYGLGLWQGESASLHRNELLGTIKLNDLEPGEADPVPVTIELLLSSDCLLKVVVTNHTTRQSARVLLTTKGKN